MRRGGKRAAVLTVALGVSVIGVSLWVARMPLVELWYLHKLESGTEEEKCDAASKLGQMGSVRAVPGLLRAWVEADGDRHPETAASFLQKIPIREKAIAALDRALRESESSMRRGAVHALSRMGPDAAPALLAAMEDQDLEIPGLAVMYLRRLKPSEAEAVLARDATVRPERLLKCLRIGKLVHLAASTLARMGERAVPDLLAALLEGDDSLRAQASQILVSMRPPRVQALQQAFREGSRSEKKAIASSLKGIGPRGSGLVADLIESARDPELRGYSVRALGWIGAEAETALPVLIAALKDPSPTVRYTASCALGGFGAAAAPAVPALLEALAVPGVRAGAASSLGAIGPPARAALPALQDLLSADDRMLRGLAAEAIEKIEGRRTGGASI